jgi:hypothetical protein
MVNAMCRLVERSCQSADSLKCFALSWIKSRQSAKIPTPGVTQRRNVGRIARQVFMTQNREIAGQVSANNRFV